MEKRYRKYFVIMLLCFLMGGFSIIMYCLQTYSAFMGIEVFGSLREFGGIGPNETFRNHYSNETGERFGLPNATDTSNWTPGGRFMPLNPMTFATSPSALLTLFFGIISIVGGISIFNLIREKEIKVTKEKLTSILLSPEEKLVIDEIKKARGEANQSHLVIRTGLSKVKIHRIVAKLEQKGIVKKYQYGLTNKVILQKDV